MIIKILLLSDHAVSQSTKSLQVKSLLQILEPLVSNCLKIVDSLASILWARQISSSLEMSAKKGSVCKEAISPQAWIWGNCMVNDFCAQVRSFKRRLGPCYPRKCCVKRKRLTHF